MVEQQELRAQECFGILGLGHSRQDGGFGPGVSSIGKCCAWNAVQPVGDGRTRSSVMAALIDQADAKRRCVEVVPSTLGNHV